LVPRQEGGASAFAHDVGDDHVETVIFMFEAIVEVAADPYGAPHGGRPGLGDGFPVEGMNRAKK
jgi:hypothetical protein